MIYRIPVILLPLLFVSSCATVRELPGLGSDAKTYEGQMVYTTSRRSVVGDVILRTRANGDYDLAFSKGGVSVLQFAKAMAMNWLPLASSLGPDGKDP